MQARSLLVLGVIFGSVLITKAPLFSQVPDTCLVLAPGVNPDSILLDTCAPNTIPKYKRWYGRRWFRLTFDYYVIDLPAVPKDSLLEVDWRTIDDNFVPLRSAMEAIEQRFGSFILRKVYPQYADSSHVTSKIFDVRFAEVVNIDSATNALQALPSSDVLFLSAPGDPNLVPVVGSVNRPRVWPLPADDFVYVDLPCTSDEIVRVLDVLGRETHVVARCVNSAVANARVLVVDVRRLTTGLYGLESDGRATTTIIIR